MDTGQEQIVFYGAQCLEEPCLRDQAPLKPATGDSGAATPRAPWAGTPGDGHAPMSCVHPAERFAPARPCGFEESG